MVYFQFAGVTRAKAEAISDRLAERGYDIPGEERIKSAAGLHEVRYFFEGDAASARRLKDHVNRVLADAGYKDIVKVADATGFRGGKPAPGTLELWLEPMPVPRR